MLVALDPGVKTAGVAVFASDGKLAKAWLVQTDDWTKTAIAIRDSVASRFPYIFSKGQIETLITEVPQIYTADKQKGRQKDLVDLAVVAGMFLGCIVEACKNPIDKLIKIEPVKWKRNLPKSVVESRLRDKLSSEETASIELPARSLSHNVWDAVGIGMWWLKKP